MSGIQNAAFDDPEETQSDGNKLAFKKVNGESINLEVLPHEVDAITEDTKTRKKISKFKIAAIVVINLLVVVYFSFATRHFIVSRDTCVKDCALTFCSPYGMLLFVCGCTYAGLLYFKVLKRHLGTIIERSFCAPARHFTKENLKSMPMRIVLSVVLSAAFFAYIVFETFNDFTRLRALGGIAIFMSIGYFFSANRSAMNWRPVICGAIFQFLLGVLLIRWPVGRAVFACFGDKVAQFLEYGKNGAAFVFGDFLIFEKGIFAFAVLSTIYFFSLCISVCYYLGIMQWVLFRLGWILQSVMGTTVCESVNAAGNIFLGMSEGPLVIRPYIKHLTHSEIHAIIVSGFSTVSGSVLVAYISFGAEPAHLITASVMAAPASLFFAKLIYPEVEESKTSSNNIQMEKSSDTSVIDAASNGASQAINLILNIIANLVAFVAFIAFVDSILVWLTSLLGFENINIKFFMGKIFIPVSWLIGVDWKDCEAVGSVIGTKTIINEFVAFKELGDYKAANKISSRSSAIATFAICSFANPASVGIMIGALAGLAPEKRPAITKVALRGFFAACLVTLCTASIAGLLITDEMIQA